MRAVVHERYGPPDVLRLADVARPVPAAGELLVRVHATTVSRTDIALRAGTPFASRFITGLRRPKRRILGSDFAGVVETGAGAVDGFTPGDRVFGTNPWRFGTHAEYVCIRAGGAVGHMPTGMSFEDAAAICDGAILALNAIRPAHIHAGQRVLVLGASGSIGTASVQLARSLGADVTAVCRTKDFDLVRSLGADDFIDYTQEDFTGNGRAYDVIVDAVGAAGAYTFSRCKGSLKHGGVYVATDRMRNLALAAWTARIGDRRVVFPIPPKFTRQDVEYLKGLIEEGKYRAVIDRRYPFESAVEATRYVERKQKTANVVLTID